MSVEDFIIAVYCWVDDVMKEQMKGKDLRQRGFNGSTPIKGAL